MWWFPPSSSDFQLFSVQGTYSLMWFVRLVIPVDFSSEYLRSLPWNSCKIWFPLSLLTIAWRRTSFSLFWTWLWSYVDSKSDPVQLLLYSCTDIWFVRSNLQLIPNFTMKCVEKSWLLQMGFSAATWPTVLSKLTDRKSWKKGCLIKNLTFQAKGAKAPGKHLCQMRIHSPHSSAPSPPPHSFPSCNRHQFCLLQYKRRSNLAISLQLGYQSRTKETFIHILHQPSTSRLPGGCSSHPAAGDFGGEVLSTHSVTARAPWQGELQKIDTWVMQVAALGIPHPRDEETALQTLWQMLLLYFMLSTLGKCSHH